MESASQTTGGGGYMISIAFRMPMVSLFNSLYIYSFIEVVKILHEFVKIEQLIVTKRANTWKENQSNFSVIER